MCMATFTATLSDFLQIVMVYFTIFLNLVNRNVIILKLNQVTVDDEEGSHDSLTFQQLQTMLLEQFGENLVFI